jgi:hypothetical protein
MTTTTTVIKKIQTDRLAALVGKLKASSPEQRISFVVWLIGALLALVGGAHIFESFAKAQSLGIRDPIFSFPFRTTVFLLGFLELLVASFCLFTINRVLCLWLIFWLVLQLMVYRISLWQMSWPHPYALTSIFTDEFFLSARTVDFAISLSGACLVIGGIWMLFNLRSTALAKGFLKMACPACGVRIQFSVQNIGQNINCPKCFCPVALRRPEEKFKISCFFCHEHIEFPSQALGTKMACPHCNMDITLKESA